MILSPSAPATAETCFFLEQRGQPEFQRTPIKSNSGAFADNSEDSDSSDDDEADFKSPFIFPPFDRRGSNSTKKTRPTVTFEIPKPAQNSDSDSSAQHAPPTPPSTSESWESGESSSGAVHIPTQNSESVAQPSLPDFPAVPATPSPAPEPRTLRHTAPKDRSVPRKGETPGHKGFNPPDPPKGTKKKQPAAFISMVPEGPDKMYAYIVYDQPPKPDPTTFEQATSSPEKADWWDSMREEVASVTKKGTYKWSPLPKGCKAIGSKWVYKTKRDENHLVRRRKARVVAKGFTQRKGIDFHSVFAPVARMTSQRIVVSIATEERLNLYSIDVDNAYLNGDIDVKIYMKPPKGFEHPKNPDLVWELQKGLYGLKQAGNIWNAVIHSYLVELGFTRTLADRCVYTKVVAGKRMALALHVDDFLVAANEAQFAWFVAALQKRFSIKYEPANMCLGVKVTPTPTGFTLDQQHYLESTLKELGLESSPTYKTPMTAQQTRALVESPHQGKPLGKEDHHLYRQIVGKLMYAMVSTRPDLAYALSVLGRYAAAPTSIHLSLAKQVVGYVRGSVSLKLHFRRGSNPAPTLHGYVDSDYANSADRKSTTGFLFFVSSCLISWCSKKQPTVATSTTVAEYIALYESATEAVWLRGLMADLSCPQSSPTVIREDNMIAMQLAEDDASHKRTKHIDVKYHYTKEQQDVKTIRVERVDTADNLADFFTKALPRDQFQEVCKRICLSI